jgi:hypothetical protein
MDPRTRNLFVLAFVLVIGVTAAATFLLAGATPRDPGPPADASTAVGVIVGVQSTGLDHVAGFTLRTTDQGSIPFKLGDLENGAQFPPGHLVEHQATAAPVRVWYHIVGTDKVVIRLEDAPP